MRKLKVCFINAFFYPTIGGVESHIQYTAEELMKKGYDIEVFTSDMDRDSRIKEKTAVHDGIKISRFKTFFKISFAEMFFPGVFNAVKQSDADIFHVHGYRHLYNFIFLFTDKPIFLTPHWPIYKGQRSRPIQAIVDFVDFFLGKYIFKHFTKVCVVTELESPWVESFNVKKENILLTPNAIPESYFKKYNGNNFRKKYGLKNDETVVMTMSRLHQSKGIDQLVKVAKYFPKVKFVIMGKDGGYREYIETLIKQDNLTNVIIAGEVSEKEKLEAYAGSDIFCSPSHYEGFCISIIEAMSQGCAVLTSDQGGMPWVVGTTGLIFKDYDLDDLKNKLDRLVNDKKLLNKFKKDGVTRSKGFKWKNVADTLDIEYKKLIAL